MKPVKQFTATSIMAFVSFFASQSFATPFFEVGDANQIPALAQNATGIDSLDFIVGDLSGPNDVDMYLISINGGGIFSASTVGGAENDFDTQLFLFNAGQIGVYANDDDTPDTFQSLLPAGNPLTPTSSGLHYLAISSFDNDPLSLGGLIFPNDESVFGPTGPGGSLPVSGLIVSFDESIGVFGPTGPGGSLPVIGWNNDGSEQGRYVISLTGAQFANVPEPTSMLLVGSGLVSLWAWRLIRSHA